MLKRCLAIYLLAASGLFFTTPASAAVVASEPDNDDGLLDPAWFNNKPLQHGLWRDVDYAYWKPGLILQGKTIWVKDLAAPVFLGKQRDEKDQAKAAAWSKWFTIPLVAGIRGDLVGRTNASQDHGDYILEGRSVDFNAGSRAMKILVGFGAGQARATFDMKLTDAVSGEIVAGWHHRTISGTDASTIESKTAAWVDKWCAQLAQRAYQMPAASPSPSVPIAAPIQAPEPVSVQPASASGSAPSDPLAEELRRLEKIHIEKLITEDEFQALRKKAIEKAMK